MPKIYIDGKEVAFEQGDTIVQAAKKAGIIIPTLCWLDKTNHGGVCRICSVSVEGYDNYLPACATDAMDGMVITSQSPELTVLRKNILSMLVAEGRHDCFLRKSPEHLDIPYRSACMEMPSREKACPSDGACDLQRLVREYRVPVLKLAPISKDFPVDSQELMDDISPAHGLPTTKKLPQSPIIRRDFSRCVQCGRCASVCADVQVTNAIAPQFGRREAKFADTQNDSAWWPFVDYERCTHCGECVQYCPTGALSSKKDALIECQNNDSSISSTNDFTSHVRTTCPYCGVGCQLDLTVHNGRIIEVNGVEDAEPNHGSLCVKGRFGYDFIYAKDRLTDPLIRLEDGTFKTATWDEAITLIADKFSQIMADHGPDAIAGVSCSRSINEDSYQMQKLFRTVFKTNNIDNCSRT